MQGWLCVLHPSDKQGDCSVFAQPERQQSWHTQLMAAQLSAEHVLLLLLLAVGDVSNTSGAHGGPFA